MSAVTDTATDTVARIMGPHILIVEARFYEDIADELVRGAIIELEKPAPPMTGSPFPARSRSRRRSISPYRR